MLPAVWSAPHTPKSRRERQEVANFLRLTGSLCTAAPGKRSTGGRQPASSPTTASSSAGLRHSHSSPRLLLDDTGDWCPSAKEQSLLNRRRGGLTHARFTRSQDEHIGEVMPL